MIPVAEIFGPTIQGEGPDAGLKSIFVRVAGCDFACSWCDSKFAWNVKNAIKYEEQQLLDILLNKCKETNCNSVILTGGNPCLYTFGKIVYNLSISNIQVGVETQGSYFPDWLECVTTLVLSPKAPSSGQPDVMDSIKHYIYSNYWTPMIALKIPIFNDKDFNFAQKYYDEFQDCLSPSFRFYLSVGNDNTKEDGDISKRILKSYEWLINKVAESSMNKVYVLPQIHTLVWGNKQGV